MGRTPPDSITAVHWKIQLDAPLADPTPYEEAYLTARFVSQFAAEQYLRLRNLPGHALRVEHTYRVGDRVEVHTRGRWRAGTVTALRVKRITVKYKRNKQGDWGSKTFYPVDIRPATSVREGSDDSS